MLLMLKLFLKKKMIPLLCNALSWDEMVRLFTDTDFVIDYIECDKIVDL